MSKDLFEAYEKAGGNIKAIKDSEANHLVINSNRIISSNNTKDMELKVVEEKSGVSLDLVVKKNVHIKEPVYLCFGVVEDEKVQNIKINMLFEKNSSAKVLAHCVFPNAKKVTHNMDAKIVLEENSTLDYEEVHFHGESGVILVNPKAEIFQDEKSVYLNKFSLLKGLAGNVLFDYTTHLGKGAKCELNARVNAIKNDYIKIIERAFLEGNDSNALLNTRVVLSNSANGIVENTIIGEGANSRGHMDCVEIINGEKAVAKAIPVVEVKNKTSKITHEAAIGSVDKASLNTLMSRGLSEEEAVRVIISGLLN